MLSFIIIFGILCLVKFICFHIELVGWKHYSNKLVKQDFQKILDLYDGDKECAIIEYKDRFRGIDSELGAKKELFLSQKGKEYKANKPEEIKINFSIVNNKSQKLINFWDYYFNYVLCRKDLRNATDPQIKVIYYARLVSSIIDLTIAPHPVTMQFISLFITSLEVASIRKSKSKKIDEKDLPESVKRKLEKAA